MASSSQDVVLEPEERKDLPPLQSLRVFEAAARLQSFTKAADELGMTVGAVSQHVRRLESFAQARLFLRRGRGVKLTALGEAVSHHAKSAFEHWREAGRLMRGRGGGEV